MSDNKLPLRFGFGGPIIGEAEVHDDGTVTGRIDPNPYFDPKPRLDNLSIYTEGEPRDVETS